MLVVGYVSYRRASLNLEGKLDQMWSQALSAAGRKVVQDEFKCCGYYNSYRSYISPFPDPSAKLIRRTMTRRCHFHTDLFPSIKPSRMQRIASSFRKRLPAEYVPDSTGTRSSTSSQHHPRSFMCEPRRSVSSFSRLFVRVDAHSSECLSQAIRQRIHATTI